MVYGFAAAGFAGFMLTAVPNWTGASPLAALALLWLAGRLAMTLTTLFPPRVAAGIVPSSSPDRRRSPRPKQRSCNYPLNRSLPLHPSASIVEFFNIG
jgi:hypothetical protein